MKPCNYFSRAFNSNWRADNDGTGSDSYAQKDTDTDMLHITS